MEQISPEQLGWIKRPDVGRSVWEKPDGSLFSFPPHQQQVLFLAERSELKSIDPTLDDITERQLEVLKLLVAGHSNKSIARQMKLGEGTIKIHIGALYRRLKVRNRVLAALLGAPLIEALEASSRSEPDKEAR